SSIQTLITGLLHSIEVTYGVESRALNLSFQASVPCMSYVTSIVLHDRRCWLEQFEPRRYQDPAVGAFAREKVKVEADPKVEGTGAAVEIRTTDGAVHSDRRAAPKGDPCDPLTRGEIEDKLRTAAAGVLPDPTVRRIIGLVADLERVADVRELAAALRAPA